MEQWSGYLGLIVSGAGVTVQITLMACALALVAAFIGGLGRVSRFWPLRWLATAYIEFFRGTSMERGAAMHAALAAGHPVEVEELATLADSLGGGIGH